MLELIAGIYASKLNEKMWELGAVDLVSTMIVCIKALCNRIAKIISLLPIVGIHCEEMLSMLLLHSSVSIFTVAQYIYTLIFVRRRELST